MHLLVLSLRGRGVGHANHGILTVRSFPRVGVLIIYYVIPTVGKFDMVAILVFRHLGKYPEGIWMSFKCSSKVSYTSEPLYGNFRRNRLRENRLGKNEDLKIEAKI